MALMRTGIAEIKNRFNAAEYLRKIDPEAILDHYGARNQTEQRGRDGTREIVHSCLINDVEPHHAGNDENPSAAMNTDKATYICYSYWSGGIFDFVLKMERKEHLHEIVDVLGSFLGGSISRGERTDFLAQLDAIFRASPNPLPTRQAYNDRVIAGWRGVRHPYAVDERGLNDRAYERLALGYDPATRRLVFPHYVGGRLLGWQQRAIPDRPGLWPGSVEDMPKYRNNGSFPKSSTLYNIDAARAAGSVVVVESPMSVAWAVGRGMDNCVATFGATVTDGQIDLLRELGEVTVWFDDDPAGWKAERKVTKALIRTNRVKVIIPEKGRDLADSVSIEEVHDKLANAKPGVLRVMDYGRN